MSTIPPNLPSSVLVNVATPAQTATPPAVAGETVPPQGQPQTPQPQTPSTQTPPAQTPVQKAPDQPQPAPNNAQPPAPVINAEVVKLPPVLANTPQPTPIRGDVVAINDQGNLVIQTPRGSVEVKLPPNLPPAIVQAISQPGARLMVDVANANQGYVGLQIYQSAPRAPVTYTTLSGYSPETAPVTAQGLYRVLKTSLQNLLKSVPAGEIPAALPRPIGLQQMVRLIPLTGQNMLMPLPQVLSDGQTLPMLNTGALLMQGMGAVGANIAPNPALNAAFNPLLQSILKLGGAANTVILPQNISAMPLNQAGGAGIVLTSQAPLLNIGGADVKIAQIIPNMGTAPMASAALSTLLHGCPNMPVLTAQVVGQTPSGLPVLQFNTHSQLQAPIQNAPVMGGGGSVLMAMQFPASGLQTGTLLQMNVLQTLTGSHITNPLGVASLWGGFDELLDVIQTNPAQATQNNAYLQTVLPKPGAANFSAPVLMFMAAARGGDATAWLGERLSDSIRNMRRSDVLMRLSSSLASAASAMRDEPASAGEWRNLQLPLLYDHEIARLNMHYRYFEREGDGKDSPRQKGTRFILDVSLSRMGDMQVDGLSFGKQLDVTLRSKTPFSESMRQAMRTQYTHAIEGIGFAGVLNFAADDKWVEFN